MCVMIDTLCPFHTESCSSHTVTHHNTEYLVRCVYLAKLSIPSYRKEMT